MEEFSATVQAVGVLAEADDEEDERVITDYTSLLKISPVDIQNHHVSVLPGNYQME